nr:hypothetical protein Csa_4G026895 [Ipomoea batatas]
MLSLSCEFSTLAISAAAFAAVASLMACFRMSLACFVSSRAAIVDCSASLRAVVSLRLSSSASFIQLTNPISLPFQARRDSSASNVSRSMVLMCSSVCFLASSKRIWCFSSVLLSVSFNLSFSSFRLLSSSSVMLLFFFSSAASVATSFNANAKSSMAFLVLSSASIACFSSFLSATNMSPASSSSSNSTFLSSAAISSLDSSNSILLSSNFFVWEANRSKTLDSDSLMFSISSSSSWIRLRRLAWERNKGFGINLRGQRIASAKPGGSRNRPDNLRPTKWQKACKGAAKNKVNWLPSRITSVLGFLNDGLKGDRRFEGRSGSIMSAAKFISISPDVKECDFAIVDESLEALNEQFDHLITVQNQGYHQKPGVKPQLLEPGGAIVAGAVEVLAVENGLVEDVGLEEEASLASAHVLAEVELTDPGRDLADLPALQPRLEQLRPVLLLVLPQPHVGLEHLVKIVRAGRAAAVSRQVPHPTELLLRSLHQRSERARNDVVRRHHTTTPTPPHSASMNKSINRNHNRLYTHRYSQFCMYELAKGVTERIYSGGDGGRRWREILFGTKAKA